MSASRPAAAADGLPGTAGPPSPSTHAKMSSSIQRVYRGSGAGVHSGVSYALAARAEPLWPDRAHGGGCLVPTAPLLVLLALSSCAVEGDAHLYAQALTGSETFLEARELCLRIRDPASRGDCEVAVMERWQRLNVDDCRTIARGPPELSLWRDECMFQLAERMRARGDLDRALETCLDTRFARQCSWHLVQDEAEASLDEAPAVAERRIARFVAARRIPDAPVQFWAIRFRTAAAAGRLPDEAICNELAQPAPCRDAVESYVRTVLDAWLRGDPNLACGRVAPSSDTVELRPAWVEGPYATAAAVDWRALHCGDTPTGPPGRPD